MRFAVESQYSRAMRALHDVPIADMTSDNVLQQLHSLHPAPLRDVTPLPPSELPPPPDTTEGQVLHATRSLSPTSAPGLDLMSPRLVRLLAFTSISPQAGITGLSTLTALVSRLAKGDIPASILPLLTAAALLPIQPRPDKIRSIAIGQALRRPTTKALLPMAIQDTTEHLSPEQLANRVCAGMDSIVHDCRMLAKGYGHRDDYVCVSIDARNAFNACSCQKMLKLLPTRAPTLARFINMVYGRSPPPLTLPANRSYRLQSREGTQQGDPASMLLFSLTIHPLLQKITRECRVTLNRWDADEGTLVGPVDEVARALRLLTNEGPLYNFHLNATKTRAFWPTSSAHQIATLERVLPLTNVPEGGIELLGAPTGSDEFIRSRLRLELSECRHLLTTLDDIPDARIKLHLHRVTASACRVQHLFKLVPPNLSYSFAQEFDCDRLQAYSRLNLVPVSPTATEQTGLRICDGGHGFISIARVTHASYAASLIASARLRVHDSSYPHVNENFYRRCARSTLHTVASMLPPTLLPENYLPYASDLSALEPASLLQRPEGVHTFFFQALHTHAARVTGRTLYGNIILTPLHTLRQAFG